MTTAANFSRQFGDFRQVSVGPCGDDHGPTAAYDITKNLIANGSRPNGIFCYNDPVALGTMRAILDTGLRIPEDIAVVGCGNLLSNDFLRVSLTSVDQGSAAIGEAAAKIALH